MSEKHKKTCKYIKHLLILVWTVTDCVLISAFASLVCASVGIASSAVGLTFCAVTAWIKKHRRRSMKK